MYVCILTSDFLRIKSGNSDFFLFLFKVAGIVGRADLLCALFFLLSFLGYCKAFRESKHYVCTFKFAL